MCIRDRQNTQHPQNVFSGSHGTQTSSTGNQFSNHQNVNMLSGQQILPNVTNTTPNSNIMGSQQNLPNFVGAGQANVHGPGNIQQSSLNIHDNQYNSNNVPSNQQGSLGPHTSNNNNSNNNNSNVTGEQQNMSNMRLVQSRCV